MLLPETWKLRTRKFIKLPLSVLTPPSRDVLSPISRNLLDQLLSGLKR